MADLDTNIPQLSFGQSDKETTVNELFDAASPSMLFGRNGLTSAGLGFGLLGGRLNGLPFANVVITLPDNATIYLSIDLATRVVDSSDIEFKAGNFPLYKLTTSGGLVTNYEDHRQMLGGGAAGPLVMADITDKQGKVLDDRIPISNWEDVRDGITTKGGYLLANDGTNGYLSASLVDVVETGGIVAQAINSPIFGQMSRYYTEDDGWSEYVLPVTSLTVEDWYSSTSAEAANAVINADGTFSRSVVNVVTGPANTVDGALAAFDSTSGGQIKDGEAPSDGKTYGRKDAQWVEVTSGGGGSTAWADITGKPAVIGAGSNITNAQAAIGIFISPTAPVSPAEGTIWIKA